MTPPVDSKGKKTVEIRIKDGDKVIYLDNFKLGDHFDRLFGGLGEPITTPEHPHDDELTMIGYNFVPAIINLKTPPERQTNE